jgi:hypothetical protein
MIKFQQWRHGSLKVGDRVDVIRHQKVRDLVISGWTRGQVVFKGLDKKEEHKVRIEMDSHGSKIPAPYPAAAKN